MTLRSYWLRRVSDAQQQLEIAVPLLHWFIPDARWPGDTVRVCLLSQGWWWRNGCDVTVLEAYRHAPPMTCETCVSLFNVTGDAVRSGVMFGSRRI